MAVRLGASVIALALAAARLHAAGIVAEHHPVSDRVTYFWKITPVGDTAQLVTLFCRACGPPLLGDNSTLQTLPVASSEIPLVSVLRDNLGDKLTENDRLTSVWLLGYVRPSLTQRGLSAVPFFYWRVGHGSVNADNPNTTPWVDLTSLQSPTISEIKRDIFQWALLDPATTPIRATSRAYRVNETDHKRLQLEETISYLRAAAAFSDPAALSLEQLNLLIARLELRKKLLGGFVNESAAARLGEEENFKDQRIRSRNWELLRQCADKTGIYFDAINLAGTEGKYAMLWFPLNESVEPTGSNLKPVWKLLNIKDPWHDERLSTDNALSYRRSFDATGTLLPEGTPGMKQMRLVPLGIYSLDYPKFPLLLIDFRDKLHVRWRAMTQRSINEVTSGVIGISHFTNWYYYVAADLYDLIASRHGSAVDQPARLDCYSQFRAELAMDQTLNPTLRGEMEARVNSLAMNPLDVSPVRQMELAAARYQLLLAEANQGGRLQARVDKSRRAELARDEATRFQAIRAGVLHEMSLGMYTRRVKPDAENFVLVDRYRRAQYQLAFLDRLAARGTQPEVAYNSALIQKSVTELSTLLPQVDSSELRVHAEATLRRLQELSRDTALQADYSLAMVSIQQAKPAVSGDIAAEPAAVHVPHEKRTAVLNGVDGLE